MTTYNVSQLYSDGNIYNIKDTEARNSIANLASVATSGDYNDLTNKPAIPASQVQSDWNATSGMGVILNKPTIPTTVAELSDANNYISTNNTVTANTITLANVATSGEYNDLLNKPTIPAAQVQSDWNATTGMGVILNKPTISNVGSSGEYNDLLNKPTIPSVDQTYNASSTNAQSGTAVANAISSAISAVYKPAGSSTFANLPTPGAAYLGNVYNMSEEFTIDNRFVEYDPSTTKTYPAGTNVVVVNTGTDAEPVYKFDVLTGFIDLSPYALTNSLANVATSGEYSDLLNAPTWSYNSTTETLTFI